MHRRFRMRHWVQTFVVCLRRFKSTLGRWRLDEPFEVIQKFPIYHSASCCTKWSWRLMTRNDPTLLTVFIGLSRQYLAETPCNTKNELEFAFWPQALAELFGSRVETNRYGATNKKTDVSNLHEGGYL